MNVRNFLLTAVAQTALLLSLATPAKVVANEPTNCEAKCFAGAGANENVVATFDGICSFGAFVPEGNYCVNVTDPRSSLPVTCNVTVGDGDVSRTERQLPDVPEKTEPPHYISNSVDFQRGKHI